MHLQDDARAHTFSALLPERRYQVRVRVYDISAVNCHSPWIAAPFTTLMDPGAPAISAKSVDSAALAPITLLDEVEAKLLHWTSNGSRPELVEALDAARCLGGRRLG